MATQNDALIGALKEVLPPERSEEVTHRLLEALKQEIDDPVLSERINALSQDERGEFHLALREIVQIAAEKNRLDFVQKHLRSLLDKDEIAKLEKVIPVEMEEHRLAAFKSVEIPAEQRNSMIRLLLSYGVPAAFVLISFINGGWVPALTTAGIIAVIKLISSKKVHEYLGKAGETVKRWWGWVKTWWQKKADDEGVAVEPAGA